MTTHNAHNQLVMTVIVTIPPVDQEHYAQITDNLHNWRLKWAEDIQQTFTTAIPDSSVRRQQWQKGVVVAAPKHVLDQLPDGITRRQIPNLEPVWGLSAHVRDVTYQIRDVDVHGSKHFAPGSEVFPHQRRSGDGYARAYVTGLHKETNKFVTVVMATFRLEKWQAVLIDNPIVIYSMRSFGIGGWIGEPGDKEEAEQYAKGMNWRISEIEQGRMNPQWKMR